MGKVKKSSTSEKPKKAEKSAKVEKASKKSKKDIQVMAKSKDKKSKKSKKPPTPPSSSSESSSDSSSDSESEDEAPPAKKAKVTSVPCSLLKEKSMTLGGQMLSMQDSWGTKKSEKQFELFLRKGLDYNKKASKAHAKEFAAAVGSAPEAASKIQVLLFDILNMLAAEHCVGGALHIDEVEKIANDVFDVLCSVNTDNTSTPALAPEPFTM